MQFKRNGAAAQRTAWNNPGYNMPEWTTFERLHRKLWACPSFYASKHDTVTERYCWIPVVEETASQIVENSPSTELLDTCWAWAISLRSPIHEMHIGEFRIDLNDACCLKSVWKMIIQVIEVFPSSSLNRAVYCLNSVFPHPHSYT